jgi:UDP-N-acetylmuramate: L-alanyl-gamma-D-glutamyl-meso-diaminopimelate ligase
MTDLKGKRVYLIAIAGTGMSALAGLIKAAGAEVAGSDVACFPPTSTLLQSLGIHVDLNNGVEALAAFEPDLVIIGNFVRRDHPQAQYVLENHIPYESFPSFLGKNFLEKSTNFVVVGTHGKSTTTSCLAHLLEELGFHPSFLVGAIPLNFNQSFSLRSKDLFVIEGDEYDTAFFDKESKFLHFRPSFGIWTSLEYDHADIFPNLKSMELMFEKFLSKISKDGALIYCRDWARVHEMSQAYSGRRISYGFHEKSDYRITHFSESEGGMRFSMNGQVYENQMTGSFNAQNFAAAITAVEVAKKSSSENVAKALHRFLGLKRRQEIRFENGTHRVVDDFAHHPTAVRQVIESIKARFPKEEVVVVFEPRSATTRRNVFQKEFESAFQRADYVYLSEVFRAETLSPHEVLEVAHIVQQLRESGVCAFGPLQASAIVDQLVLLARQKPVTFLILSNGNFEGLHEKLISCLKTL